MGDPADRREATSLQADVVVVGGTVVTSTAVTRADVVVRDGRIAGLVEAGTAAAKTTIEADGLLVLPASWTRTST